MRCSSADERGHALRGVTVADVYRVDEMIARGGMALVYRGTQLRLQQPVAIKVQRWPGVDASQRMVIEARTHARLRHPHIVAVRDLVNIDDRSAIVMDFVDGPTLEQLAHAGTGPFDPDEIASLLLPIIDALDYMHRRGVVHRDVKPGNILVDRPDVAVRPRLTDFGISCRTAERTDDESGIVVGTVSYVAPEQCYGTFAPPDPRSDIYSLGVCLYQMTCGVMPYAELSGVDLLATKSRQPPAPPSSIVPHISPLLESVIMRALARERRDRYADAAQMGRALRVALIDERRRQARPGGVADRALPRRPWPPRATETRKRLETPATVDGHARRLACLPAHCKEPA